jgi:hypothetical protein
MGELARMKCQLFGCQGIDDQIKTNLKVEVYQENRQNSRHRS